MSAAVLPSSSSERRMAVPSASSIEVFTEDTSCQEIIESDIDILAEQLGVDLDVEPHFRPLVEEAILAPLPPEWRPCKDRTRDAHFYYNKVTKVSQWEHPLNQVYREKVLEIRQEIAMNRMNEPLASRPPKTLPPLKKMGIGTNRPSTAAKRSSGPTNSSRIDDSLSLKSDGDLTKELDAFDQMSEGISKELPQPSSRMVKKPGAPLFLTGAGANFLKKPQQKVELEGDLMAPLKPQLLNMSFPSSDDLNDPQEVDSLSQPTQPKSILKDDEKKMLSDLNIPLGPKQGVKFIDLNPELKFDPVIASESDTSEATTSDSNVEDVKGTVSSPRSRFGVAVDGAGERVSLTEAKKLKQLKTDMESGLAQFQESLDKQRVEKQTEMRKQLEATLEQMRKDTEASIKKSRMDLEIQKNTELEKMKRDFEASIKEELDKMRQMFDHELERRRAELRKEHETTMATVSIETNAEALLKQQKEILKEDQKKLLDQLKDYHTTIVENLRKEFEAEQSKVKMNHTKMMSDLKDKYSKEEIHLQSEQEGKLTQMRMDFDRERAKLQDDLSSYKRASTSGGLGKPQSSPKKEHQDIRALSQKYDQLEKKYTDLKKGLKRMTETPPASRKKATVKNSSIRQEDEERKNSGSDIISLLSGTGSDNSDSTFYPSSHNKRDDSPMSLPPTSGRGHGHSNDIEVIKNPHAENNDRLACALKSLENLKLQILDIQKQQGFSHITEPKTPNQKRKNGNKNVKPQNNQILSLTSRRPSEGSYTSNKGTGSLRRYHQNNMGTLRPSKSTSELPGLVEAESDNDSNEIVKEAKEFIRTQKERLTPTSSRYPNQGNGHLQIPDVTLPLHPIHNLFPQHYRSPLKEGFSTETESTSGIGGSLITCNLPLQTTEKKRISKDIETICSSLSNLDEQMKMMWNVVNNSPANRNIHKGGSNTGISPLLIGNPLLPPRPTTDGISHLTPSNLLTSLDKELQEFKATKAKILSQFANKDKNKQQGSSNSSNTSLSDFMNHVGTGDTIEDKTRNLREWLEKF